MKLTRIMIGLTVAAGSVTTNTHAALSNNATLMIGDGSYFDIAASGHVPIINVNGIILGTIQPHDFSPAGDSIDQFNFLGAPGMHYTTAPTNILSSSANSASIDFSGWSWAFNGAAAAFNLGSGSWGPNPSGVAELNCGLDCSNGDSFTLAYTATIPDDEPNGYAGYTYELYLTGTVSSVPVPAAIWLFCSGLLGLAGMARYKKN